MRICLMYDCLYPHTVGGAERWYRDLAERLAADGHEVTYVTMRQWRRGEQAQIDARVRVVTAAPRMSLYTRTGRRRILPPLLFGAGALAHLLRRGGRYEVVHTCSFPYFPLLAAAAVRRLWRYELVVDWFEVWSRGYWRDYLGGVQGRVGAAVQRLCARVPQRAFCFSELHARRLEEEGGRGPRTVLRGLSPPRRAHVAVAAGPVVVFAGRMIPEKRAALGVAAVALAAKRIPGLRGVFYGDGPERGAVLAAIGEHGVEGVVSAPGFVEAEVLEREMSGALCMLLPSRREGYGLVVVEASAHATPAVVVAAQDNAAVELVEDGVNGVIAGGDGGAEAVAEAIVRVSEAGMAMRESTARWYAEHAQELSLESSLERVLESYGGGASQGTGDASPRSAGGA